MLNERLGLLVEFCFGYPLESTFTDEAAIGR
jgi:hypothetical protein